MSEPAWSWTLNTKIASSTEIGHEIIEQLLVALAESKWEGRDLFHIQMAIEEAMVNAVTHGNKKAANKQVEIDFKVSATSVYLRVKDEGAGFCPDDLPDPRDDDNLECTHGRGVMLIQEMMSEVRYNEVGNEVTMVKHRSSEKASA